LAAIQDTLKIVLVKDFTLQEIQENIKWGTISRQMAFYLVINAIPCILHLSTHLFPDPHIDGCKASTKIDVENKCTFIDGYGTVSLSHPFVHEPRADRRVGWLGVM
jgi:hypothetical protein